MLNFSNFMLDTSKLKSEGTPASEEDLIEFSYIDINKKLVKVSTQIQDFKISGKSLYRKPIAEVNNLTSFIQGNKINILSLEGSKFDPSFIGFNSFYGNIKSSRCKTDSKNLSSHKRNLNLEETRVLSKPKYSNLSSTKSLNGPITTDDSTCNKVDKAELNISKIVTYEIRHNPNCTISIEQSTLAVICINPQSGNYTMDLYALCNYEPEQELDPRDPNLKLVCWKKERLNYGTDPIKLWKIRNESRFYDDDPLYNYKISISYSVKKDPTQDLYSQGCFVEIYYFYKKSSGYECDIRKKCIEQDHILLSISSDNFNKDNDIFRMTMCKKDSCIPYKVWRQENFLPGSEPKVEVQIGQELNSGVTGEELCVKKIVNGELLERYTKEFLVSDCGNGKYLYNLIGYLEIADKQVTPVLLDA